jgi:hypothetical protein
MSYRKIMENSKVTTNLTMKELQIGMIMMKNYLVVPNYKQIRSLSSHKVVGLTMNLIIGTHHLCDGIHHSCEKGTTYLFVVLDY